MTLGTAFASQPEQPREAADAKTLAQIRAQPVCFGSSVFSFGEMGDTVLFVHQRRGDTLSVGYFVYFSVERPWGPNLLTYTLLPALAVDLIYSHFLIAFPGLQRVMYGPGDVEGATVLYDASDPNRLLPRGARADDATHHRVELTAGEIWRDRRVVLLTDVWSHQFGAADAASHMGKPGVEFRCFVGESLLPLNADTARTFRLGTAKHPRRARPAWRALASDRHQ